MNKVKIIEYKDKLYPQKLLNIKDFPKKIYALGNIELLNKKSITIIGSRDCTEYGYNQAIYFSNEISKQNICIVSGLAKGIDTAAHLGSKNEIGRTIAVLGGGFNNISPEENEELFYSILKNDGCIISEYEPSVVAESKNFPKRNRIVSGLSEGTLVVEAKYRSGSKITAKYAQKQEKPVFCIPGNIDSKNAIGTAMLIQNGAKLVLTPQEILDYIGIKSEISIKKEVKTKIKIPKEYKEIYKILSNIPININEISRKSNKNIIEVSSVLTMLEINGAIKQVGINEFVKI